MTQQNSFSGHASERMDIFLLKNSSRSRLIPPHRRTSGESSKRPQPDILKMCFASCVLVLALLFAVPAFAATITLVPSTASVAAGETVSVKIVVDAGDEKTVTLKAALSYPENMLEPILFSLAPAWMPLVAHGYDEMQSGAVIKTAGFPGGFTGEEEFGTLVFRAKGAGTAALFTTPDTLVLNTQGVNKLNGAAALSLVIVAPAARSSAAASSASVSTTSEKDTAPPPASLILLPGGTSASTTTAATSSQSAAVAASGAGGIPGWSLALFTLAVLGGILWTFLKG